MAANAPREGMKSKNNPMALQAQIRQNADEVSTMLASLGKWEKSMKNKDEGLRKVRSAKGSAVPVTGRGGVRSGAGTVKTSSAAITVGASSVPDDKGASTGVDGDRDNKAGSAAKHTYDVGYKKWENFDVDAALNEGGDADDGEDIGEFNYDNVSSNPVVEVVQDKDAKEMLTPASLAMLAGSAASQVGAVKTKVPKARGVHHDKDAETAEREQGNKEFSAGQFPQAVKSYNKCLGLKKRN